MSKLCASGILLVVSVAIAACGSEKKKAVTQGPLAASRLDTPAQNEAWKCTAAANALHASLPLTLLSMPLWMQEHSEDRSGPELELVKKSLRITASENSKRLSYRYEREGIPLCRIFGRADEIGETRFIHDRIDEWDGYSWDDEGEWSDATSSLAALAASLGIPSVSPSEILSAEPCWWDEDRRFVPAWEISAVATGQPIYGFASAAKAYAAAPRSFHAQASARIYQQNSLGPLVDVPLKDLDPSGTLKSSRFIMMGGTSESTTRSTAGQFTADVASSAFADISLFTNAAIMADWFAGFAYKEPFDCDPIEIHSELPGDELNNGFYAPKSSFSRARIYMGAGDGAALANLQTDADTVDHELGHHVVYRVLKDMSDNDSVTIHEGLADFFVYARTGDACLGESVCPLASPYCWLKAQCLRSGANDLKISDRSLTEVHVRSQVISGMLWDLGKTIGLKEISGIAIRAIEYLLPTSSFRDLTHALMTADSELNRGSHACLIYDQALARGFGKYMLDLDCSSYKRE